MTEASAPRSADGVAAEQNDTSVQPDGAPDDGAADGSTDGADGEIIAAWLHGRPPSTRETYARVASAFLRFVRKPFADVELDDLQRYASSIEHQAPATRARKLATLRSLLTFAAEEGHVERNVARTMKPPRSRDDLAQRILSEGEVTRMVYLSDGVERTIVRLLYAAGLRVSELCGLRASDLTDRGDDGMQMTVFGKGEKTREVIVSGETADELRALAGQVVYQHQPVLGMSRQQVWRLVRDAAERAGIRKAVSPHWLRHAHASHALDRGAPVHLVQQTLGHASLATTTRYAHARPDESSGSYLAL